MVMVLGMFAGAGIWWFQRNAESGSSKPVLTAEAKSYVKHLKLAEVEMKATESYLGQEIVEITGKITNAGQRPLRQVDLSCVFYDPYSQVVLRERVSIVRQKDGVLEPGQTRQFRMPFDSLPQSWNKAMPQLVIGQILF
jgi:hypothetical protein